MGENKKSQNMSAGDSLLSWFTLALFTLLILAIQFSISVMIDPLKKAFAINDVWIGILGASYAVLYTILQIPIGSLVDKYGARKIALISIGGCAFCCLIFSFSLNFYWALISRIGMGLFAAPAFTLAFYIAAKLFESRTFSLLVAFTESAGSLGGVLGVSLMAIVVRYYNWRKTSMILVILALIIFIMAVFFVKDKSPVSSSSQVTAKSSSPGLIHILKIVMRNRKIWISGICSGLLFAQINAFAGLWGVPFVMEKFGRSLIEAGWIVSLIYLGTAFFSPVMALFSSRIKDKILLIRICSVLLLIIFIYIIYFPMNNILLLSSMMFIAGMLCSVYILFFAITKSLAFNKVAATALALTNVLCGGIGALVFQPLIGFILHYAAEFTKKPLIPYYFALGVFPLSMIILILLAGKLKLKKTETQIGLRV